MASTRYEFVDFEPGTPAAYTDGGPRRSPARRQRRWLASRRRAASARWHSDGHGGDGDLTRVNATPEQLADAVGSVRAVVARALAELRRMGLIARDVRGLVIVNLPGLPEVARGDQPRAHVT